MTCRKEGRAGEQTAIYSRIWKSCLVSLFYSVADPMFFPYTVTFKGTYHVKNVIWGVEYPFFLGTHVFCKFWTDEILVLNLLGLMISWFLEMYTHEANKSKGWCKKKIKVLSRNLVSKVNNFTHSISGRKSEMFR